MKHPQQQRAQETRDRILDAAESLFDEKGYTKASMNALAKKADVSVGGLYEWFKNKEQVLTAVAERHVDEAGTQVLTRLAQSGALDLKTRIEIVLEEAMGVHQSRPRLHHFLYTEAPRPPALQAKLKSFDDAIEQVLVDHYREKGVSPGKAKLKAAIVARAGQALLHEYALDGELPGSPKSRLADVVKATLLLANDETV